MGLLAAAAKKKDEKKPKKHPSAEKAMPASAPTPDQESTQAPDSGTETDGQQSPDAVPSSAVDGQSQDQPDESEANAAETQGDPDPDEIGGQADEGAQGASPDDSDQDSAGPQGGQDGVDLSKLPISPALKEEYMRANGALYTALYQNDKAAQGVLNGIVPSGPHKIESVARMATLLVVQINKQLHFIKDAPQIVLPFTKDVVTHVLDLAQQVKKIQFTDQEQTAALGTALEIIMRTVGVSKKQMQALKQQIPRSQLQQGQAQYHQALAYTKGARQQDAAQGSPPGAAPAADATGGGGAGPNAPPASAAGSPPGGGNSPPGGPGGQPQPGAPVTAAPGPGQSAPPGGMLTQAAAPGGQ